MQTFPAALAVSLYVLIVGVTPAFAETLCLKYGVRHAKH